MEDLQGNLLISISNVKVFNQIKSSSSSETTTSLLIDSTNLNLYLIDVNQNKPPSYDRINNPIPTDSQSLACCLLLSLADGLIEAPITKNSSIIVFQPPNSYLIPVNTIDKSNNESIKNSEAFIKIQLENCDAMTIETLDSIFSHWATFTGPTIESGSKGNAHLSKKPLTPPPAHPSSFSNGSAALSSHSKANDYKHGTTDKPAFPPEGRLALMDESTGEICGELASDIAIQAPVVSPHTPPYTPGPSTQFTPAGQHMPPFPPGPSNQTRMNSSPYPLLAAPQPVIVSLMTSGQGNGAPTAQITPVPAHGGNSQIISGAEWVSRGIIAGSEVISSMITKSANSYLSKSSPTSVPMTFSSTTNASATKVLGFTHTAARVSGKTAAVIGSVVGAVGDSIGKTTGIQRSPTGEPPSGLRGYVHKGLVAFNTVLDSLETGGKKVLTTAGDSTTTVVTHTYGQEAGKMAQQTNDAIRNVGLVYIDARGVTRRAVLKSIGKAAVRGRMNDGREVLLGTDEDVDGWTVVSKGAKQKTPAS